MKILKTGSAVVGVLLSVVLLAGCGPSTAERLKTPDNLTPEPYPTALPELENLTFTVEELPGETFGPEYWEILPAVTNVTDHGFTLLTGGSGSCPPAIETVQAGEENTIKVVAVTFKELAEEAEEAEEIACTYDLKRYVYKITTEGPALGTPGDIRFEVRSGNDITPDPIVYIPDGGVPEALTTADPTEEPIFGEVEAEHNEPEEVK